LLIPAAWCYAGSAPIITLSHDLVTFYLISGQSGPVDADMPVRVTVQSDIADWALNYQATPLSGTGGEIMPDRILIRTPYTNGFEGLHIPRLVGKGGLTGEKPVDVATMQFRYMATGQEKLGVYEGNIFSPDGGPTIHSRMVIEQRAEEAKPEIEKPLPGPKIKMSFSTDKIHFEVSGSPKEYDADNAILLTVESKHGFTVKAHAASLRSLHGEIPPDRLFVRSGDGSYQSLEKDVVVLERPSEIHPEKERTVTANLSFRLKTTWDDPAGEYAGQIVFTCEPEM
jgi:hypothetical protein